VKKLPKILTVKEKISETKNCSWGPSQLCPSAVCWFDIKWTKGKLIFEREANGKTVKDTNVACVAFSV
jgi:hypothetical protein